MRAGTARRIRRLRLQCATPGSPSPPYSEPVSSHRSSRYNPHFLAAGLGLLAGIKTLMLRVTCAAAAGECGRALCGVQGGGRSLRHRDVDLRRIARHLDGLLLHRRPIPGVSTRLDLAWRLARLASAQACACGQVVLRGGGGQAVEERPDSAVAQGAQVVRRTGGSACAVNASFVLRLPWFSIVTLI